MAGFGESIRELLYRLALFSLFPRYLLTATIGGRENLDVNQYGCSQILYRESLLAWQ